MPIRHISIHTMVIFLAVGTIFISDTIAQQPGEIENCINELKSLQREFNFLLGQRSGSVRFNPSVLDTNYVKIILATPNGATNMSTNLACILLKVMQGESVKELNKIPIKNQKGHIILKILYLMKTHMGNGALLN